MDTDASDGAHQWRNSVKYNSLCHRSAIVFFAIIIAEHTSKVEK